MIIQSSNIAFASQHTASRETSVSESLRMWTGQRPDFEGQTLRADNTPSPVSISEEARQQLMSAAANTAADAPVTSDTPSAPAGTALSAMEEAVDSVLNDPRMKMLLQLIERLTGEPVTLFRPSSMKSPSNPVQSTEIQASRAQAGWGVEYERHESVRESERTQFSAQGQILTADGKSIQFDLSLSMSREYARDSSFLFQAGDAPRLKDPLVINFDGNAAQLTEGKFEFDLDADGTMDRMSFVGPGSGFLVLDKNSNGRIDDGSELFGTRSGDGFADLAAYDDDGNGWIDENDAIFAKLQIWTKDAQGNDVLSTLFDHDIGALYLGRTNTDFSVKDQNNALLGQIRSTGVYLHEDGRVGTMQQVDLVV